MIPALADRMAVFSRCTQELQVPPLLLNTIHVAERDLESLPTLNSPTLRKLRVTSGKDAHVAYQAAGGSRAGAIATESGRQAIRVLAFGEGADEARAKASGMLSDAERHTVIVAPLYAPVWLSSGATDCDQLRRALESQTVRVKESSSKLAARVAALVDASASDVAADLVQDAAQQRSADPESKIAATDLAPPPPALPSTPIERYFVWALIPPPAPASPTDEWGAWFLGGFITEELASACCNFISKSARELVVCDVAVCRTGEWLFPDDINDSRVCAPARVSAALGDTGRAAFLRSALACNDLARALARAADGDNDDEDFVRTITL